MVRKMTSHLDPVFDKLEYKWLKTSNEQRAFGKGNNYCHDEFTKLLEPLVMAIKCKSASAVYSEALKIVESLREKT